jgi:hypothetical protein
MIEVPIMTTNIANKPSISCLLTILGTKPSKNAPIWRRAWAIIVLILSLPRVQLMIEQSLAKSLGLKPQQLPSKLSTIN